MLSKQLISELGEILKNDFDQKLSIQEVEKIAQALINYFELITVIQFNNQSKGGEEYE